MLDLSLITNYFKEISSSLKFQLSAAVTFGVALFMVWFGEDNELKIFLTVLFLFPTCMFLGAIIEKLYITISKYKDKKKKWSNLSREELDYIKYYIDNETKMRYVPVYNGTYENSGIINPLISKNILYLASKVSEFRGEDFYSREQTFPINITDEALEFFKKHFSN